MKMEIGLSMLYCLRYPFAYLLRQLSEIEVNHVELVDEGLHTLSSRRVNAIRKVAQARGLQFTVHAPLVDVNLASPNVSFRRATLKRLKRSIYLSSQLDSRLWVFHSGLQTGVSHLYPGQDWELNLKSVRELLDAAEEYGVELAIENTPDPFPFILKTADEFVRFYGDLGRSDLALTLDVAHAHINGQLSRFFERLSDKIVHAHLHDNHGEFDYHLGIGRGNINWPEVTQMFKKINYKGALIIESETNIEESIQTLKTLVQNA